MTDLNKIPPALRDAARSRLEAEARKFDAEAGEAKAEGRYHIALAKQAELEFSAGQIALAKELEKRERELASDYDIRFYRFHKAVTDATAAACMATVAQWARVDKVNGVKAPHYKIQFNSPGGSVWDGLALFDELQHFRSQGIKITTSTIGMAASMAGILLQAGDVRRMAPESWILIHKTSFGAIGDFDDVADRVKLLDRIQDRILDIFAARAKEAGEKGTAEKPISRTQLVKNWNRKDWWVSSDEALKFGLVDEVR